jgi:hypothetical protein
MTHRTDSLWSSDIQPDLLSPREILEAQADALREQSGGLLASEVGIARAADEPAVHLTFDIAVPAIAGSRHRLLIARHPSNRVYPCMLEAGATPLVETAYSHGEFRDRVRQVLTSGEVTSLALSLIADAKKARRFDATTLERRHAAHKRQYRPAWAGVAADDEDDQTDAWAVAFYDEPQGID